MTTPEADASPVLPIWRGRRGLVATVILGVLAVFAVVRTWLWKRSLGKPAV